MKKDDMWKVHLVAFIMSIVGASISTALFYHSLVLMSLLGSVLFLLVGFVALVFLVLELFEDDQE